MITPEQETGIEFWSNFYVQPYKAKLYGGNPGAEKYLLCYFTLIKINKDEPTILKAYAYWSIDELEKKYQTKNREHLLKTHRTKLPKDGIFYIHGILKSSLPGDFIGTTLNATIELVASEKEKNAIDSAFENIICINNIYDRTNTNEIIDTQFVKIATELKDKLGIYIDLKENNRIETDAIIDNSVPY